ncbi:transposase [Amycolatopsis sp. NPDC049868]|uniref:transposase n=1 Tax=Amycolatopsis sp. NPDC049868 TaxID=3363934 RepID=UPI0037AFAB4A
MPLCAGHSDPWLRPDKDVVASRSSRYPGRFRQDAIALVHSTARPLTQVAGELGVDHESLRTWIRNTERAECAPEAGASVSGEEQERELRELRTRVAELEPGRSDGVVDAVSANQRAKDFDGHKATFSPASIASWPTLRRSVICPIALTGSRKLRTQSTR